MASSGTFTGSRPLSDSPQAILTWSILEQSITNNQSKLRLTLKVYSQYNVSFSATKSGVLDGTSFSYSGGMSGVGQTVTVYTKDIWVTHNSDGTKSVSLSGSFDIKITWGGNWLNTLSVSGTAVLDSIPRASVITSFPDFTIGSGVTVQAPRMSTSYTNTYVIMVGSTTIASKSGQGDSCTFSGAELDGIYSTIPNSNATTAVAYVSTFSGGTQIGDVQSRSATASVGSSIIPTLSSVSAVETVSALTSLALGTNQFVQNLSRIRFTINGALGAKSSSVTDYSITFNGVTYGQNGVTGAVNKTGNVTVTATVKDSRGRTSNAVTLNVNMNAYSSPTITQFTVVRNSTTPSTVNVTAKGTISSLNGKNRLTYTIKSKPRTSSTYTNKANSQLGVGVTSLNVSPSYTGYDTTLSYDWVLEIADLVGTTAVGTLAITTESVPMSWSKTGTGIGKVWEQGALDVGGHAYFSGDIYQTGGVNARFNSLYIGEGADLNNYTTPGMYYCPANATVTTLLNCPTGGNAFSLLVEQHAGTKQTITRYATNDISTWVRNKYSTSWGSWYQININDGRPASHNHVPSEISLEDHTSGSTPRVVGVIMGTGNPPTASSVPQGTIYLKYT